MPRILKLYKKLGETPLECIERYRKDNPVEAQETMTYLGRLDPMAEGLLLVLAGDTRKKEEYLAWDKTYEFEVLWGFETDTYDVLGIASGDGQFPNKLEERMAGLLKSIGEKKTQSYPPFSSKVFRGNFLSVRGAKSEELNIPERGIKIFDIKHLNTKLATSEEVTKEIMERIDLVKGDFRQVEVKASWERVLKPGEKYFISQFRADVSSGTYIRSLSHEMGKILGTGAIAFSIKRIRVGEYEV